MSFLPINKGPLFFVGVGGSGMSALAQIQAMAGGIVMGSDRDCDAKASSEKFKHLTNLGIKLFPQDGTGIDEKIGGVVKSTAIEDDNPDVKAALKLKIPVYHRSQILADFVNRHKGIAVAGTSGKSTVTAMIFDLLNGISVSPSVITGGELVSLIKRGLQGNAFAGSSELLVVEADESDGSLVEYSPSLGLVLNIEKDHKEIDELVPLFSRFLSQSKLAVVNGDDSRVATISANAIKFGTNNTVDFKITNIELRERTVSFSLNGVPFMLPSPGYHTVMNGAAALTACSALGFRLKDFKEAASRFAGVNRRFQSLGVRNGIEIIDDYAHNPAKVRAAIVTAQKIFKRVLAIYQPHGFGPTRFLRKEFIDSFAEVLRDNDVLYMPEIFYAGGSVIRDISSEDIVKAVVARGKKACFCGKRQDIVTLIGSEARSGDCVLVMGARDASLTHFAMEIIQTVK